MQFIGKLQKYSHITSLPNPQDQDVAYCEERHEYYMYSKEEGKWKKREFKNSSKPIEVSLYDLNKSFYMSQEPITDENIINEKIKIIKDFSINNNGIYYMLLCKELSYYTILKFEFDDNNPEFHCLGHAVTQLIKEYGWDLYDVYLGTDEAHIEVWVKCPDTNELHCLMLFLYDMGIVTFGG